MSGAVVSSAEAEDESVDGELSAAERAILADIEGL